MPIGVAGRGILAKPPVDAVTEGLIGWWKHDEGSGSTLTDAINGNDATLEGGTWTSDAKTGGQAVDYDGTDDRGRIPDSVPTSEFRQSATMCAWAKPHVVSGSEDMEIIGINNNASFELRQRDGGLYASIYDGGSSIKLFAGSTSADSWQHYATTWDGSDIRGFIDGEEVGSTSCGSMDNSSHSNEIANYAGNPGKKWFDGPIDDVRAYRRALSSDEISRIVDNTA